MFERAPARLLFPARTATALGLVPVGPAGGTDPAAALPANPLHGQSQQHLLTEDLLEQDPLALVEADLGGSLVNLDLLFRRRELRLIKKIEMIVQAKLRRPQTTVTIRFHRHLVRTRNPDLPAAMGMSGVIWRKPLPASSSAPGSKDSSNGIFRISNCLTLRNILRARAPRRRRTSAPGILEQFFSVACFGRGWERVLRAKKARPSQSQTAKGGRAAARPAGSLT